MNVIHSTRIAFQFHSFDQDYLQRLASGDAFVQHHFSSYFGDLLLPKLRVRIRSPQLIEDILQETLLRVLQIVRRQGVEHPESFGAFVCAVRNNVMRELVRREMRLERSDAEFEPPDETVDLDAALITQQTRRQVQTVLDELPANRFGVTEDYLRVLRHRAKSRFRKMYSKLYSGVNGYVAP